MADLRAATNGLFEMSTTWNLRTSVSYRMCSERCRSISRRSSSTPSKSPRDTTPSALPFSVTGTWRKFLSHINRNASIAFLSGDIEMGSGVITWPSVVLAGIFPAAKTRHTASRPVKIPIRRPASSVTRTEPARVSRICWHATFTELASGIVKGCWSQMISDRRLITNPSLANTGPPKSSFAQNSPTQRAQSSHGCAFSNLGARLNPVAVAFLEEIVRKKRAKSL